jgi:peptidoglycan biosynthesis protein MviN/MurJ (putative lipid II flippase)
MPPEVKIILMHAIMNPATLVVGYWLGRKADQVQKVVIAAFIAGLAGTVYAWLIMKLGFAENRPRLIAGVLVASGIMGIVWSWLGHWTRGHRDKP